MRMIEKKRILYLMVIGWLIFHCANAGLKVCAQEEGAKVINNFMEIEQDIDTKMEPSDSAETGERLQQGESVLVLTETEAGWYQILYHSEIRYIRSEYAEEQQFTEGVDELDVESEKYAQISQEEMKSLVENGIVTEGEEYENVMREIESEKKNRVNKWFTVCVFGGLFLLIGISGAGYLHLKRKEEQEEQKNRKHIKIIDLNEGDEDER